MRRCIYIMVALLAFASKAHSEDLLQVADVDISKGQTATIDLVIKNPDNQYTAIQADLYLPDGIEIEKVNDNYVVELNRTTETHSFSIGAMSGFYRLILSSSKNEEIIGSDGKVISLSLKANANLEDGSLNGSLKKIKLAKKDGTGKVIDEVPFNVIVQEMITLTAKSYTRLYGDANPTFEFTSSSEALTGTPQISCEATATSPVGTYDIIVSQGSVTNNNVTFVKGTLTITKAPLTIKVGTYTKKQGEDNPEFTLIYEGFKNNETDAALTKKPAANCEATKESNPGEYAVTVSGAEAQNYGISYVNGTLTIAEADPVTVTAKNYTRVYGDANPTFEYTSTGATLTGTPQISCEATASSPVGTYDIIVSKGGVTNYNVTYVKGTLTITKAPLTVKANSYTITQGDALPTFEATYSGFKNNETSSVLTTQPSFSCSATSSSVPGTYDIIVSNAAATNYEISYENGSLTVTPGTYTLTYVIDGIEYKSSQLEYGTTITPEAAPTKEGYTFSGWSEVPATMPANDVTITGSFTINKYKLTYMVDGEEYRSSEIEYGATITPEAEPTKEGYSFSGWSNIPTTMPAHDVTVTGTFSKGAYKLIYKVDGEVYKTINYDFGATITSEAEPTKEGYTFSGWSEIPSTMPANDVTVTGSFTINKYKLIYKVDGEVYKTVEKEYGSTIMPEAEPTKEGYTFSGWSDIPQTMPANDVTVSGTFSKGSYKLTYKIDGEVYKTINYDYGATITPEVNPTKEGYSFSGWSEIPSTMPAKDVTVTGTFTINKYKLIYKVDGEEFRSFEIEYGTSITPIAAPTKDGYDFSGWDYVPETMPAHDVIVNASFTLGITDVMMDSGKVKVFDTMGNQIGKPKKGVNIIRTRDGKTKKVMVK